MAGYKVLGVALSLAVGFWSATTSVQDVQLQVDNPDPLQEDRFAFLPYVFIDLGRERETNQMMLGNGQVRRCSRDDLNCLIGRTFRIVWPQDCADYSVGQSWELSLDNGSKITSTVLAPFNRSARHTAVELFLVKTEDKDDFLYVLREGRGLIGLVHDPLSRGILEERATDPAFLEQLASGITRTEDNIAISYLAGSEPIGVCQTASG